MHEQRARAEVEQTLGRRAEEQIVDRPVTARAHRDQSRAERLRLGANDVRRIGVGAHVMGRHLKLVLDQQLARIARPLCRLGLVGCDREHMNRPSADVAEQGEHMHRP